MSSPVVMIQKNGQLLRSLTLEGSEAILGRAEGCVIRLDDRAVSRQHAVLKSTPGGLTIEKKSHLAPLVVNGAECDSAELREGDEICIGPYVLRISQGAGASAASGTALIEVQDKDSSKQPVAVEPMEFQSAAEEIQEKPRQGNCRHSSRC